MPIERLIPVLCLLVAAHAAAQPAAHRHGVAELKVAVDGGVLAIDYEAPLDDLVGFEHAPRTTSQRRAVAEVQATLRDFGRLFVLPTAAGCTVREATVTVPWPDADAPSVSPDEHDSAHDVHGGLRASYVLDCAHPEQLHELRLAVFGAFPRTRRVDAEWAARRGQGAAVLTPGQPVLPL